MATLSDSVQFIKSVGPKRAESFKKIGLATVKDLLYYFPARYLDRTNLLTSARVMQYVINGYEGEVTVIGEVIDKEIMRFGKKQVFKVKMRDTAGFFECVWFQGIRYFKNYFNLREIYAVSAKPVITRYGHLQFAHPDFDRLADTESTEFRNTGKIIPFYRIPKELKSKNIGELSLRKIIHYTVENYVHLAKETLPIGLVRKYNLLSIDKALKNIHEPEDHKQLKAAIRRFKFEELFYLEILIALRRTTLKRKMKGYSFKVHAGPIKKFLDSLPFELTKSQLKVLSEIKKDMISDQPMNRLLQGDVGSGKTIVAVISMLIAITDGAQAALMAPTEILANQHFLNIKKLLEGFGVNTGLIIGGQKKSEREKTLEDIASGKINLVVGTHALFEEAIEFKNLRLVVIDEQHRFGVIQRSKFIEKGIVPDVLVMSATPIPRTLTMTIYGDLDVSVIDEMPENRKEIKTVLTGEKKLPDIYKFIVDKAKEGYQSFIVYPLVEDSEKLTLKAAVSHFEDLSKTYLKDVRVGMIHGKMNWRDKEEIMKRFAAKEFDVLISTTVIEVGIDIPDANILVINDAFQFGLAQLHQLRGRVGRSDKQAYCILVAKDEMAKRINKFNFNFEYLSKSDIERYKTLIRLNSMVKYSSGFKIAEVDLKLRGPGDIFGLQQSGFPDLKYADIIQDSRILLDAKKEAFEIIENDPELLREEHRLIKNHLMTNYRENLKYSQVP